MTEWIYCEVCKKLINKNECDCEGVIESDESDCDLIDSGGFCLSCDKEFKSVESWLVHMKKEHVELCK